MSVFDAGKKLIAIFCFLSFNVGSFSGKRSDRDIICGELKKDLRILELESKVESLMNGIEYLMKAYKKLETREENEH